MTNKRKRTADDDANDALDDIAADDAAAAERDTSVAASLERVLAHAEGHGEAYVGAVDDHATIRAALSDGRIVTEG